MNRDTLEIVKRMDTEEPEMQLALHCAPLIFGLKPSNLLILYNKYLDKADGLLSRTGIPRFVLFSGKNKTVMLLYHREPLMRHLLQEPVQEQLCQLGYRFGQGGGTGQEQPDCLLRELAGRYRAYLSRGLGFPHEMGLFLGYPAEDVEGFMKYNGKNFLYNGYWKVYADVEAKRRLFGRFDLARERLVRAVAAGRAF